MGAAERCERRIRELLGESVVQQEGTLHVTSAWRGAGGTSFALAIGEHAPESATDFWLLNLMRARADAIVSSGAILRSEPSLRHDLQGTTEEIVQLEAFRQERLGRSTPPRSVFLTRGTAFPFDHPLLARPAPGSGPPILVTSETAAGVLARHAARAACRVEVVARRSPSLRDCVSYLRNERGLATVSIEAGPSASRELYEEPAAVDELVLAEYEELDLPIAARAGPLASLDDVVRQLGPPRCVRHVSEESGRWCFRRYRRDAAADD